jgi:hypothetical protein
MRNAHRSKCAALLEGRLVPGFQLACNRAQGDPRPAQQAQRMRPSPSQRPPQLSGAVWLTVLSPRCPLPQYSINDLDKLKDPGPVAPTRTPQTLPGSSRSRLLAAFSGAPRPALDRAYGIISFTCAASLVP